MVFAHSLFTHSKKKYFSFVFLSEHFYLFQNAFAYVFLCVSVRGKRKREMLGMNQNRTMSEMVAAEKGRVYKRKILVKRDKPRHVNIQQFNICII